MGQDRMAVAVAAGVALLGAGAALVIPSAGPAAPPTRWILTLGLTGLAVALIAEPRVGFGGLRVWFSAVVGLVALVAFALVERGRRRPGVGIADGEGRPRAIALLSPGSLSALTLYTLLVYAGLGALVFFLLIQLQAVAEYSAVTAGAAVLPGSLIVLGFARLSLRRAAQFGPQGQLVLGPLRPRWARRCCYGSGPMPSTGAMCCPGPW